MSRKKIAAVILAGGRSSRMNFPKPLLKIGKKTFLEKLRENIQGSGINDIYLVLGADERRIRMNLNKKGLNIVYNPFWKDGQLSSLKAAVKRIGKLFDAILMCLIDHPQVAISTINMMVGIFSKEEPDIVIPTYSGKGGHPVLFGSSVFEALLSAPLDIGAKAVTSNKNYFTRRVEVDDKYVLQDIDTLEDLRSIEIE